MRLPRPKAYYDVRDEERRNLELEQADRQSFKRDRDETTPNGLTIVGRLQVGLTAILDYVHLRISGAFTSGGAAERMIGLNYSPTLTAANGDTTIQLGVDISPEIATQGNSEVITDVATVAINEPQITLNTGDSITNATTLKVNNAPTEGTNNYALWVDDGAVRIDQGVALGGGAIPTLGTIGGSGPSAAAQAQWLQVDINGTTHWIPVWT